MNHMESDNGIENKITFSFHSFMCSFWQFLSTTHTHKYIEHMPRRTTSPIQLELFHYSTLSLVFILDIYVIVTSKDVDMNSS